MATTIPMHEYTRWFFEQAKHTSLFLSTAQFISRRCLVVLKSSRHVIMSDLRTRAISVPVGVS